MDFLRLLLFILRWRILPPLRWKVRCLSRSLIVHSILFVILIIVPILEKMLDRFWKFNDRMLEFDRRVGKLISGSGTSIGSHFADIILIFALNQSSNEEPAQQCSPLRFLFLPFSREFQLTVSASHLRC